MSAPAVDTDFVCELLAAPLEELLAEARRVRTGPLVTYSPKVFPLTTLCRDVCGYCTFARPPRRGERAFMREDVRLVDGCPVASWPRGSR